MEYKLSNVDVELYKKNGFVTPNIPVPESLLQKMKDGANNVITMMKDYYDIDFNVPLDTEVKIGYNWLEMREV